MVTRTMRHSNCRRLGAMLLAGFMCTALAIGPVAAQDEKRATPATKSDKAKSGTTKPHAGKSAAPKPTAAKPDAIPLDAPADEDDKRILSFVGDDTFAVVRIDPERIDFDALARFAVTVAENEVQATRATADQAAKLTAEAAEEVQKLRRGFADFRAVGGRHIYVLLGTGDMARDGMPMVVAPYGPNVDVGKWGMLAFKHAKLNQTTHLGRAALIASPAQIVRLSRRMGRGGVNRLPPPGPDRPDLIAALAAAGNAPVRVALVPGKSASQLIEKNLPALPGGGDTKLLSRGIRSVTMAVNQKPEMSVTLTVRAINGESADGLMALVGNTLGQMAGVGPEAVGKLVKRDGQTLSMVLAGNPVMQGVLAGRRMAAAIAAQRQAQQPAQPSAPAGDGLD